MQAEKQCVINELWMKNFNKTSLLAFREVHFFKDLFLSESIFHNRLICISLFLPFTRLRTVVNAVLTRQGWTGPAGYTDRSGWVAGNWAELGPWKKEIMNYESFFIYENKQGLSLIDHVEETLADLIRAVPWIINKISMNIISSLTSRSKQSCYL